MADVEEQGSFSEHYPRPPIFWRQFTESSIVRLKECQASNEPVPEDLRALVPPPLPADGKYRSFGANWNLHEALPDLADIGQQQLYPSAAPDSSSPDTAPVIKADWTLDRAFHLQKMVRSILLNFLELVGTLSQDAAATEAKLADLTGLFVNALHILNEYRPHQARETLILLMEEQVQRRRDEIEAVKGLKDVVDDMSMALPPAVGLSDARTNGVVVNGHGAGSDTSFWEEFD